jgi:hypothetical protein
MKLTANGASEMHKYLINENYDEFYKQMIHFSSHGLNRFYLNINKGMIYRDVVCILSFLHKNKLFTDDNLYEILSYMSSDKNICIDNFVYITHILKTPVDNNTLKLCSIIIKKNIYSLYSKRIVFPEFIINNKYANESVKDLFKYNEDRKVRDCEFIKKLRGNLWDISIILHADDIAQPFDKICHE